MNLTTNYLGLSLRTPLVPSASPLTENPDNIKRMEDAGASAIVFHSLFEEQIRMERKDFFPHSTEGTESFAEALSYLPEPDDFKIGPDAYLEHIARAKKEVRIPIIGSLNGSTPGGWTDYAKKIQQAGADALELNLYSIPTDFDLSSQEIEDTYLQILKEIKSTIFGERSRHLGCRMGQNNNPVVYGGLKPCAFRNAAKGANGQPQIFLQFGLLQSVKQLIELY